MNNAILAADNKRNKHICSKTDSVRNPSALKEDHADLDSRKLYEPLMLSYNLKKNCHDLNNSVSTSHYDNKQLTLSEAKQNLNELRQSIITSNSSSALLHASYLLSINGVLSLLKLKLDDD